EIPLPRGWRNGAYYRSLYCLQELIEQCLFERKGILFELQEREHPTDRFVGLRRSGCYGLTSLKTLKLRAGVLEGLSQLAVLCRQLLRSRLASLELRIEVG